MHGHPLLISTRHQAKGIAGVIIHHSQRMARAAAKELHGSVEIHLPQWIGLTTLKPLPGSLWSGDGSIRSWSNGMRVNQPRWTKCYVDCCWLDQVMLDDPCGRANRIRLELNGLTPQVYGRLNVVAYRPPHGAHF